MYSRQRAAAAQWLAAHEIGVQGQLLPCSCAVLENEEAAVWHRSALSLSLPPLSSLSILHPASLHLLFLLVYPSFGSFLLRHNFYLTLSYTVDHLSFFSLSCLSDIDPAFSLLTLSVSLLILPLHCRCARTLLSR